MDFDGEKLEQVVLTLFQMNLSDDSGRRVWKSLPWSVMDSLHQKGYISDPATKNKSVWLSEEGLSCQWNSSRSFLLQSKSVQTRYEVAADRSRSSTNFTGNPTYQEFEGRDTTQHEGMPGSRVPRRHSKHVMSK